MIQNDLQLLRVTRENILGLVKGLSLEQLDSIPEGLNNSLIWNIGHVIVTQQLLVYKLSGLDPLMPEALIEKYRKGSKPDGATGTDEWEYLQEAAFSLIEQTEADYHAGKFSSYIPYTTSYRVELTSVEQAIGFNNMHESMHLGNMLVMKKLVG